MKALLVTGLLAACLAGQDARATLLPPFEVVTLDTGLTLLFVDRPQLPVTTLALYLDGGLSLETPTTFRHLPLAMGCLWMGAGGVDEETILTRAEAIGGTFGSYVDVEHTRIHVSCLTAHAEDGLDLLWAALTAPDFADSVLAREAEMESRLLASRERQMESRVHLAALRAMFGAHRYVFAHALEDTAGALPRFDGAAARQAAALQLQPRLGTLFVIGPRRPAFEAPLRVRMATWQGGDAAVGARPAAPQRLAPDAASRLLRVEQEGRTQIYIQISGQAAAPDDPRYPATLLVQSALGAGFTSPMIDELRVRRGWIYALGFRQPQVPFAPPFSVVTRTQPEHVADVLRTVHDLLHRASSGDLLNESHLQAGRNLWRTEVAATIETPLGLCDVMHGGHRTHGDYRAVDRLLLAMAAVDVAALRQAAAAFDPDATVTVIAGPAAKLAEIEWR